MIDDEANFDNILDASEVVQTAAKFRPKQRVKPRKTILSSRSAVSNRAVETGDGKLGALNQINSSKELTSQERSSLTCPGSETVDNVAGSQGTLETPPEDVLTVPLGTPADTFTSNKISQDDEHNADLSKLATHQESLVISDIHVSPASSCGKTIDDIDEFEELFGAQAKEERVAKFPPKLQTELHKAAISQKTNQKVELSTVDVTTQNERGDNIKTRLHYDQLQDPTNDNITAATPMVGICAENNNMSIKSKDQVTTAPATCSPQDVDATVDLDYHNELINSPIDGTQSMVGEVSAEDTCKSQPNVGREKGKGKSVSFSLSDVSGVVTPRDTNSEMGNFSDSCNDKLTDENLSNLSQQTSEKNSITEEQHSYDQEHNDGEPLHHAVEQQPKSVGGETGSSMKLQSRKKPQKVGTPKQTDDCFDEDCVEASLAEDIDSGDDYTAGTKRKVRKKSRDGVEESRQQKVQKDKSQVSSRGRKRTLKDTLTEEPEKKLTHRIRQRRAKEVKSLLEKPSEEINPMKLSAAHLRLLQEARERVNAKENPSGPSSNTSFQLDDMDDLDYRDDEGRNFDNDRTENHVQNVTKLNYGSYMNKQTRGKWSKSDTDVFYKGLRQFGSDFAMIQQLLPDKTRHQVRAKFKAEEKKNPLLVHDAIIHRSGDNLYFKKVIKNLNIEDVVLPEVNNIDKQDGTSSEQGPGKEDVLDDFINGEEDDSNWLDEDHGVQKPDVEEERAFGNDDDDDLGNVFDWY